MTGLDLRETGTATDAATWRTPDRYWPALTAATAHLDAPVGALHLGALRHNAHDMRRRANGTPIRVASKSIRVREVVEALLRLPGYRGVLAYTLAEALWLADTVDDVVVGYPTAERGSIRRLALDPDLAGRITLMVDSPDQLDLVDSVRASRSGSASSSMHRGTPPCSATSGFAAPRCTTLRRPVHWRRTSRTALASSSSA